MLFRLKSFFTPQWHYDDLPNDILEGFFNSSPSNNLIKCENCLVKYKNNECFVYKSSFVDLSNRAITFESVSSLKFLHSKTYFRNCSMISDGNGGSIYVTGSGTIIQHQFCCYRSMIKSGFGVFTYSSLDSLSFSYIVESSLYNCGNPNFGDSSLRISEGTAGFTYSNASKNAII